MRWRSRALGVLVLCCLSSCGDGDQTGSGAVGGALPAGVVARVGNQNVADLTVARIAHERAIPAKAALDLALQDAVLAAGAEETLGAGTLQHASKPVLGRALLRQLWLEAQTGPITDAELEEATDVFWTRYDRPEGKRAVHALAMAGPKATEEDREAMRRHADRMREAVQPAAKDARTTAPEPRDEDGLFDGSRPRGPASARFIELAKAVPLPQGAGFTVRVEELPVLTSEAHGILHGAHRRQPQTFNKAFTDTLFALTERGDLTEVVETPFGYHVIMLVEVTPAHRLSKAERLDALRAEILRVRGLRAKRALLEKLKADTKIDIASNQDALLGQIEVVPSAAGSTGDPTGGSE